MTQVAAPKTGTDLSRVINCDEEHRANFEATVTARAKTGVVAGAVRSTLPIPLLRDYRRMKLLARSVPGRIHTFEGGRGGLDLLSFGSLPQNK